MVVMKGVNDDEVLDFVSYGRTNGVIVRFIEFVPLDADETWENLRSCHRRKFLSSDFIKYDLEPLSRGKFPAARWKFTDGPGEIGIIATVSEAFVIM